MSQLLYFIVEKIALLHNWLMSLNDSYGLFLSDKGLHFLVMGAVGMVLLLIIHPLFAALAENGHTLVITWIYVFTVMIVLTFAIEIGQGALYLFHRILKRAQKYIFFLYFCSRSKFT